MGSNDRHRRIIEATQETPELLVEMGAIAVFLDKRSEVT
jgi:hypothetical protein